jgi:DNA-binding SARP family transcriptional activator
MLNRHGSSNGKGKPKFPAPILESLPDFTLSPTDKLSTYSPLHHHQKLNELPVADTGISKSDNNKNVPVVESLSIWPALVNLLKAEQYDRAAELLLKAQLAEQPIGSEANVAFLVMAREICLTYRQYQAEIAAHQQAFEAANRRARELSQQLYTIFTRPDEPLESGKWGEVNASWDIPGETWLAQEQMGGASTSLKICCLGPFRVYLNGQLISEWSSLKARSIFKYLVAHADAPTTSDTLMDIFWPDAEPDGARHSLHQAIHSLRKTLKQGVNIQPILFENDGYLLNPELNVWLDYIEFEKQVQLGQRLERAGCLAEALTAYRSAAEFYRGDFLVEDRYEDWSGLQREYLRQVYIKLVDQLSETYLQRGEFTETIGFCQKILIQDNCHEAAHRRLIRCYLLQGQRHSAIRQYQLCVQTLKMELDVPPSPATQLLYQQIIEAQ